MVSLSNQALHFARLKYVVLIIFLLGLLSLVATGYWKTQALQNANTAALLNVASIIIAVIISCMAWVRYYSKENSVYIFLAIGFLCTSLLDTLHLTINLNYLTSNNNNIAAHLYLSIFLAIGCRYKFKSNDSSSYPLHYMKQQSLFLILLAYGIFSLTFVLPTLSIQVSIFSIPQALEIIPAILFGYTLAHICKKTEWMPQAFNHWLMMALITCIFSQILFSGILTNNTYPTNNMPINVAYALKLLGLVFILIGLMRDMALQSKQIGEYQKALTAVSEHLRETSVLQNAILHSAQHMIISTNISGFIKTVNAATEIALGYPALELLDRASTLNFIVNDEIKQRAKQLSEQTQHTVDADFSVFTLYPNMGKTDEHIWTFVRKDTSNFSVHLSVTALRDKNKKINGYLFIAKDITEELKNKQNLIDSESRLRAVLETVADGIIIINSQCYIETANLAAEKIFKTRSFSLKGKSIKSLMSAEHGQQYIKLIANYLHTLDASKIEQYMEVTGVRSNNSRFPMEISFKHMQLEHQIKFTGVIRDITERKRIEQFKNEFVSTVSHELRTPLTSIRGSIALLASGAIELFSDKVQNLLNIAHSNTERLLLLINDLLDIQKIESGNMELKLDNFLLTEFLQQAITINQPYADQYSVCYQLSDNTQQTMVYADFDRIMQVMNNLLSNAAKFSPTNATVEIISTLSQHDVQIDVIDHGIGIPKDFQHKLFSKFTQYRHQPEDNHATSSSSGLGLSIAKAIVEMHLGTIHCDSEQGRGSRFYFKLPLSQAQTVELNPHTRD